MALDLLQRRARDAVAVRDEKRAERDKLEQARDAAQERADELQRRADELRSGFGDVAARAALGELPRDAEAKARTAAREATADFDLQVVAIEGLDRRLAAAEQDVTAAEQAANEAIAAVAVARAKELEDRAIAAVEAAAQALAERRALGRFVLAATGREAILFSSPADTTLRGRLDLTAARAPNITEADLLGVGALPPIFATDASEAAE